MCGICFSLNFNECKFDESNFVSDFEEISLKLKRRGPDDFQELKISNTDSLKLNFISSVLHLRGSLLQKQPVQDEEGNILLWNGELFDGPLFHGSESDTKLLSQALFKCQKIQDVLDVIESIYGPYAFVFYQKNSELLWFGRDVFGRRSLLWNTCDFSFNLCSFAFGGKKWQEVPSSGLFCLDLKQNFTKKPFTIYHYPWSTSASGLSKCIENKMNDCNSFILKTKSEILLNNPISKSLNKSLPSDESIFDYSSLLNDTCSKFKNISSFLKKSVFEDTLELFESTLSESVRKRVQNHLGLCRDCYNSKNSTFSIPTCNHASVGILFSGGIDSIVIAALAHQHIPESLPIDLLNVAFSSKIKLKECQSNSESAFNTPDRITGRNGCETLHKLFPSRVWNFVEVNISEDELVSQRRNVISYLLKPFHTVLDDSIGCAIWFAARGEGYILSEGRYLYYKSPARVLLVGMGADEQLGGYSRHRVKFNNSGWPGLLEELALELDRIGSRNLGRDDRIIADHSVESRYPFLDENVVSFLNDLPVWLKMNLNLPRGLGEKLLLRLLALKLGLEDAAVLPKRAIQFGSRIARIENTKEKGSDICDRLV